MKYPLSKAPMCGFDQYVDSSFDNIREVAAHSESIDKVAENIDRLVDTSEFEDRLNSLEQSVSGNSRFLPWQYNAEGGEQQLEPPYNFTSARLFINGVRQRAGVMGSYYVDNKVIHLAEPLEEGDWIDIELGTDPIDFNDAEVAIKQIRYNVNNLNTTREAIEWCTGLKITDPLQLYTYKGVKYLPDIKAVPFITGSSFNADNWVLSELATKDDVFKILSATVYSSAKDANLDAKSVVIGGLIFNKTTTGLTPSKLVITQSDFYFTTKTGVKYVLSESTTNISGRDVGVGDGKFDCLGLIKYCAKRGISLDLRGGGRYLVKYSGADNTCAIAGNDILNGFKLTTDSAVIEKGNTLNSRIMFECTSERAALFEYNRYGFNIEDLLVESVNIGKGVILYTSRGGAHYSNIASITGVNMYQTVNLQRIVYLSVGWMMSLDCVKAPQFYNNMVGNDRGTWVWNSTGDNGWYNNEIQINRLIILGAKKASAIVASDLKIGQIDISRCTLPASGILAFGRNGYKDSGNIIINQFYSELNANTETNPVVTFDNVFDVKINQVTTTEGSQLKPSSNIFTFKNSKNITIPSPKNYGFIKNYITADNSLVKIIGEHSIGYLLEMFKTLNGGRVYCELYKTKRLLFSGIKLTDEYQTIGEPLIEDIMYSVKGFEYSNGIATAFSIIIKPSVDLPIVVSQKLDFKVITNPTAKGYLLQAKRTTREELILTQMVIESMNDYVS